MKTDECGFRYPEIDPARCIHCDLCRRVCPLPKNHVGEQADPAIYAVRNHDADVLQKSSSGGMFTLLADWVLGQGGVVYGVAFDEAFAVRHMRATSHEVTERFRTSKYVESDPAEIYNHIRDNLAGKAYRVVFARKGAGQDR
ncbi:MAG: 4Fe-4S binding protein [Clostridiales bacterium]|nr:4Fe-4S binding protein [Clostridiales bacterium]